MRVNQDLNNKETSTIVVNATDSDEDTTSYSWSHNSNGTIEGNGYRAGLAGYCAGIFSISK